MPEERRIHFAYPPRTFVPVPGYTTIWEAPERKCFGLYLWCLEIDDRLWVNYVGKTSSMYGFEGRLWRELKDWRCGKYLQPIDIDALLLGRRVILPTRNEERRRRALELLQPRYRILLAPLEAKDDCLVLEGAVVNRLRRWSETLQFLSNRDIHRGYRRGKDVELFIESSERIVGLNVDVEICDPS